MNNMVTKQPLASGLFTTPADQYGWFDEEPDNNLIIRGRGSNQFLGGEANHHDGQPNVTGMSNKVQPGRLSSQGPSRRAPTAPTQARPTGIIQND
jgi:hypothetical protein